MPTNPDKPRRGPVAEYKHDHPPVRNVNDLYAETMTMGAKVADRVATVVGSWGFIIVQSCLLIIWMIVNVYLAVMISRPGFLAAWDPYPFILLNLVLSFQAAYTGPVVMMSQNRQNEKDRLQAQQDFEINRKAEKEIEVLMRHLAYQDEIVLAMQERIEDLYGEIRKK
jgi:uncharacterized membrane protein